MRSPFRTDRAAHTSMGVDREHLRRSKAGPDARSGNPGVCADSLSPLVRELALRAVEKCRKVSNVSTTVEKCRNLTGLAVSNSCASKGAQNRFVVGRANAREFAFGSRSLAVRNALFGIKSCQIAEGKMLTNC
jgi:hypothetical protein